MNLNFSFQDLNWYDVWRIHHDGDLGELMIGYVLSSQQCCLISAFHLLDVPGFQSLTKLDISGCINLDPSSITEICGVFTSLSNFTYKNCPAFSQYHIAKFVDNVEGIKAINGVGSGKVSATFATGIAFRRPALTILWLEPTEHDLKQWGTVVYNFCRRVNFGPQVARIVPGRHVMEAFEKMLSEM